MHGKNETLSRQDQIISLLNHLPEGIGFSAENFDQIARLENLREHLDKIDEGAYLDNFMSSLDWWLKLAHVVLRMDMDTPTESATDIEETKIESMLKPIMTLYPQAFRARYQIDAVGSDPQGLQMIHRFGELRRYICRLIQRDVQGIDTDHILKLA